MQGKFIVLYGINNLGKTTQAKLLTERLKKEGYLAEYLKYPVYDLNPSGPLINGYLREDNPYNLSAREVQILYSLNRWQYQSILQRKLQAGINIVSEDYLGTGLCWGIGSGVEESFMRKINSKLLKEDLVFLFEGDRFVDSTENNHLHENNDWLIQKVKEVHCRLGKEFGWLPINANEKIEEIHEKIWQVVKISFLLSKNR